MRQIRSGWTVSIAGAALACTVGAASCNNEAGPGRTDVLYIVGPEGNFRSIAAALSTAPEGEVIEVRGGPYAERVVVNKRGMKLRGVSAILDGATIGGTGIGIHVTGVADVEISGFTVRNFERGIVVQSATNTVIRANEVHSNNSKTANTAPPLAPGVDLFEGVVLIGSSNSQVSDNTLRDNGHDGLMITGGSRNNIVRGNRMRNNGAQTTPGRFGWGINLFSGPENTGNQITDNEVTGNHWGILVGNFSGNSGNVIRSNRVRDNGRAGIAAVGVASGNTIEGNDARNNALLNIAPSLLFDLFDAPPLDNTWQNNQGSFNFAPNASLSATASLSMSQARAVLAEAFSEGGCLGPGKSH